MTHQEYTLAKRALFGGSHVVIATVPVSEQRIRVTQMRIKNGHMQGKYINDGKWYLIYQVEIQ